MSDWRIAGGVMDERAEWLAAQEADPSGFDAVDEYDPADDAERRGPPLPDPYTGTCGGCGRHVSTRAPGGSCLWKRGAWHPACRRADPDWQEKYGSGVAASAEPAQKEIVF